MKTNLHVNPELWRDLKIRAIQEGTTATGLLNRIIEDYLKRPLASASRRPAKKRR